ncbi:MFS transporter [Lysinibacter cavernae]|uniref:GPH family glycoside/pentoside/hexuronide:cation symporter n=1 Tax=Lysinibacter cavernae TaxID=1640652 RepID=A0A7X5QYN7_9MICO|nr:MFS transporter [Lysinibacter cavernae]NIH52369.1 GPH family glycoside/pentoside/hexuronide:cation symporter [Lysinibacter cavernae]
MSNIDVTNAGPSPAGEVAVAPLKRRTMAGFGAGNLSVNIMAQTFATLAVFFYVDELKADPAMIALAMGIHGVFNAVLNPIFGHLSDRTRSKWGRRLPYIMFGTVPLAAAFTMIWIPLANTPTGLFWYFLAVVLVYDVLFVLVVLNYGAVFPEMFITTAERASGSAWRQMFAIVGMILGVGLAPVLYGLLGWAGMGIALGIVAVACMAIAATSTVERRPASTVEFSFVQALGHTLKNRAFVSYVIGSFMLQLSLVLLQASVPFYTKYVLGDPDPTLISIVMATIFLVAIPMVYAWGIVIRRFGAKLAILATIVVYAVGLIPFLFANGIALVLITAAVVGIAVAGMLVLLDILLAEVIDLDAERNGVRREGMFLGVNGFIVRWSVTVQAAVIGGVLAMSGYDANLSVQPESVALGVRLMIAGIPLGILVLAFIAYLFYPIADRPQPVTEETL